MHAFVRQTDPFAQQCSSMHPSSHGGFLHSILVARAQGITGGSLRCKLET
jgi:hypothetical protein